MSVIREYDPSKVVPLTPLIIEDDTKCTETTTPMPVVDWSNIRKQLLTHRIKDLKQLFKQVHQTPTQKRKADLVDELIVYFTTNVHTLPVYLTVDSTSA